MTKHCFVADASPCFVYFLLPQELEVGAVLFEIIVVGISRGSEKLLRLSYVPSSLTHGRSRFIKKYGRVIEKNTCVMTAENESA